MQFKVRNGNESGLRPDGRSANDLKNDIFEQFISQVDKNEKAQAQAAQQPQMGTIEMSDIVSARAAEARKARAEAQARQINEDIELTTGRPPAPKIEMDDIENNSKAQEQAYWNNIHNLAESADPTPLNPAPQMDSIDNLTLMAAKVDAREAHQRAVAEYRRETTTAAAAARSIERDRSRAEKLPEGAERDRAMREIAEQERILRNQPDQMPEIVIPHNSEPNQKGDSDSNS
jgi:hypothetical protein